MIIINIHTQRHAYPIGRHAQTHQHKDTCRHHNTHAPTQPDACADTHTYADTNIDMHADALPLL